MIFPLCRYTAGALLGVAGLLAVPLAVAVQPLAVQETADGVELVTAGWIAVIPVPPKRKALSVPGASPTLVSLAIEPSIETAALFEVEQISGGGRHSLGIGRARDRALVARPAWDAWVGVAQELAGAEPGSPLRDHVAGVLQGFGQMSAARLAGSQPASVAIKWGWPAVVVAQDGALCLSTAVGVSSSAQAAAPATEVTHVARCFVRAGPEVLGLYLVTEAPADMGVGHLALVRRTVGGIRLIGRPLAATDAQ